MLNGFNNFIIENNIKNKDEIEFFYSKDFGEVLRNFYDDTISKDIILSYDNMILPFSYVDITEMDDTISYLSSSDIKNLLDDDDPWTSRSRQEMKIGRMIKKMFGDKYDDITVESFINKYKSIIRTRKTFFKVLSGENIRKYYKEEFTEDNGNLGRSCMRFARCQDYLDIYVENQYKIKLLTLFSKLNKNKAIGRALLWKLSIPKNSFFLDRIYTTNDADKNIFIKYARDNGIYINKEDIRNGMNDIVVKLKPKKYKYYPYLDTLYLYQPETGLITDNIRNLHTNKDIYILDDVFGGYRTF